VATIEIHVPDIGDFSDIPVIELAVAPGDSVTIEQPLITLESDKATLDVPSPVDGVVVSLEVSVGDNVSKGTLIATIETAEVEQDEPAQADQTQADQTQERVAPEDAPAHDSAAPVAANQDDDPPPAQTEHIELLVPDIGDFDEVPVIEILVAEGDSVELEQPLITLESDKATMDVPAPAAGVIREIRVRVGDNVSQGHLLLIMDAAHSATPSPEPIPPSETAATQADAAPESSPTASAAPARAKTITAPRPAPTAAIKGETTAAPAHATPAIRRFARELGVDLSQVSGTGRKGRVVRDDIKTFVKRRLAQPAAAATPAGAGMGIPAMPEIDFSKFGSTEVQPLSRIQRVSGPHLHRAWLNIPHVTHHDEADITELEAFRKGLKDEAAKRELRVTVLAFMMKALAGSLKAFPNFNASLAADGQSLILKHYYNIGVAVDTPGGLVVPVIRDVDKLGIYELAQALGDVSERARDGKLKPADLQGGCMSISSLGGIGGTAFTPIVNAPEVAILGVTRARMQPVWNGTEFVPRLMVPLDLSYDHRVIDGASAARFVVHLGTALSDVRRLLL
jgi:pyruvate dehydrogenase E2 component (dihydrolipoamide acetyltransferase)